MDDKKIVILIVIDFFDSNTNIVKSFKTFGWLNANLSEKHIMHNEYTKFSNINQPPSVFPPWLRNSQSHPLIMLNSQSFLSCIDQSHNNISNVEREGKDKVS